MFYVGNEDIKKAIPSDVGGLSSDSVFILTSPLGVTLASSGKNTKVHSRVRCNLEIYHAWNGLREP